MGITIIFVIDQANVLDHDVHVDDHISNQKKIEARRLLDGIASQHMKVSSSTANYHAARYDELRETAESRLTLNHGLNDVKNLTGRMPILLRALSESAKELRDSAGDVLTRELAPHPQWHIKLEEIFMEHSVVRRIISILNKFATKRLEEFQMANDEMKLNSYRRGLEACLLDQGMQPEDEAYLDARFYYRDSSSIGRTTCHLARSVGAARVRAPQTFGPFAEKSWLNRIALPREYPAVLGFLIERAVLGVLVKNGTEHAGGEFSRGLVQQGYRYLTIAGSHSASEEGFMKNWGQWHHVMGCDSTEFKFLWIVEHPVNIPTADWTGRRFQRSVSMFGQRKRGCALAINAKAHKRAGSTTSAKQSRQRAHADTIPRPGNISSSNAHDSTGLGGPYWGGRSSWENLDKAVWRREEEETYEATEAFFGLLYRALT
ncbi:hypothetical protein BGX38DRAFT_1326580 [Terfezia claveryi]|nr:hypothetical protein BGX38DRAFT_1326580 [Terfezia claveryi]